MTRIIKRQLKGARSGHGHVARACERVTEMRPLGDSVALVDNEARARSDSDVTTRGERAGGTSVTEYQSAGVFDLGVAGVGICPGEYPVARLSAHSRGP